MEAHYYLAGNYYYEVVYSLKKLLWVNLAYVSVYTRPVFPPPLVQIHSHNKAVDKEVLGVEVLLGAVAPPALPYLQPK